MIRPRHLVTVIWNIIYSFQDLCPNLGDSPIRLTMRIPRGGDWRRWKAVYYGYYGWKTVRNGFVLLLIWTTATAASSILLSSESELRRYLNHIGSAAVS